MSSILEPGGPPLNAEPPEQTPVPTPIDDGGPAFPRPATHADGYVHTREQDGMSLRDWFAGHALAGVIATGRSRPVIDGVELTHVDAAYAIADGMLKSRKAGRS